MTTALNHSRVPPGPRPMASTASPAPKPPSLHSLVMGVAAGASVAVGRGDFQREAAPAPSSRREGARAERLVGRTGAPGAGDASNGSSAAAGLAAAGSVAEATSGAAAGTGSSDSLVVRSRPPMAAEAERRADRLSSDATSPSPCIGSSERASAARAASGGNSAGNAPLGSWLVSRWLGRMATRTASVSESPPVSLPSAAGAAAGGPEDAAADGVAAAG